MPTLERIGIHVERISHGRMDRLETRIQELEGKHRRIWFLTDGVFSMHGDLAPLEGLHWLLERFPSLHLYVDDAHGMSWTGRQGRGYALDVLKNRDRVIVALSLNKSFGAGGAALVFPDESMLKRVRHTSAPTNFTGPLQPPMLGAAVASARLHASPDLGRMQDDLLRRIDYANHRAGDLGLPLLHRDTPVPIRFIGLGPQSASIAMATHLLQHGLLPSCALFPAVPVDQSGIRFTLTRHHQLEDIDHLLETIADYLPEALSQGGIDRAAVDRAFGLKTDPLVGGGPRGA
jgi:7-keto-8-aminopelargonate synthetase-like enzyme